MVLEEALEHTKLVPLNFIQGGQPAQVLIQEAQLLINDDGFGSRCVLALADMGELDHLAGVTANRVQLRVQKVNLVFQVLLHGLHLSHLLLQLGHQVLFLLLQGGHQGVDLSLESSKLSALGILDIFCLLVQLLDLRLAFLQLLGQALLGQAALLVGRDDGLSFGPHRHRQPGPEFGRGDLR